MFFKNAQLRLSLQEGFEGFFKNLNGGLMLADAMSL